MASTPRRQNTVHRESHGLFADEIYEVQRATPELRHLHLNDLAVEGCRPVWFEAMSMRGGGSV